MWLLTNYSIINVVDIQVQEWPQQQKHDSVALLKYANVAPMVNMYCERVMWLLKHTICKCGCEKGTYYANVAS